MGGFLGAIQPPLDEQELQEKDEQRVHHADPKNDGVGIFGDGV